MRISDWSSDVCSSDLRFDARAEHGLQSFDDILELTFEPRLLRRFDLGIEILGCTRHGFQFLAAEFGQMIDDPLVDAVGQQQYFKVVGAKPFEMRTADRKSTRLNSSH